MNSFRPLVHSALALGMILATGATLSAEPRYGEIRHDVRDLRNDRAQLNAVRADAAHDRHDVARDIRYGHPVAAFRDSRDLIRDHRDARVLTRDIRHDRVELRHDVRDARCDR